MYLPDEECDGRPPIAPGGDGGVLNPQTASADYPCPKWVPEKQSVEVLDGLLITYPSDRNARPEAILNTPEVIVSIAAKAGSIG
jgi:hypothetical protein